MNDCMKIGQGVKRVGFLHVVLSGQGSLAPSWTVEAVNEADLQPHRTQVQETLVHVTRRESEHVVGII